MNGTFLLCLHVAWGTKGRTGTTVFLKPFWESTNPTIINLLTWSHHEALFLRTVVLRTKFNTWTWRWYIQSRASIKNRVRNWGYQKGILCPGGIWSGSWMDGEGRRRERKEEKGLIVWLVYRMECSILGNMDERSKVLKYILSVAPEPTSMSWVQESGKGKQAED